MPTINIKGQNPVAGAAGADKSAAARAAGFDAYEAQQRERAKAAAAAASKMDAQSAKERLAKEKQMMAMWAARNRAERDGRSQQASLLRDELRASEIIYRRQQRVIKDQQRTQKVMDGSAKARERFEDRNYRRSRSEAEYESRNRENGYRRQRQVADYENRDRDAAFRKQRQMAEYENRNFDDRARAQARMSPYNYVRSSIGSIGSAGAAAARSNDPVRALFSRMHLSMVERRLKGRLGGASSSTRTEIENSLKAVGEARAEMTGGGIMADLEGGAGGRAGALIYAAIKAAKAAYNIPATVAAAAQGAVGAAAPYTNVLRGGMDLGGAGGFNGRAYGDALSSSSVPMWRRNLGITATDVFGINSAYGVSARSGDEADSIARDVGNASYAPGLQGIPREQLASMAGRYASAGGSGSRNDYFSKLRDVMTLAVAKGVDRSAMGETIARVQSVTAGAGGAVDMNSSANLVARLMSAGNSSMRTGVGIAQGVSGIASSTAGLGFGGNTLGTMALTNHIRKNGGLKAMGTQSGLESLIGRKRADMSGQDQVAFDNALAAAKGGASYSMFATLVAPLMQSDQGRSQMIAFSQEFAGQSGLPKYTKNLIAGNVSGGGQDFMNAYGAGSNPGKAGGGKGWAALSPEMQKSVAAAARNNNIPPEVLAGLIDYESGWKGGAASGTGANGFGQVTRSTFDDLKRRGGLKGLTYADVADPDKGPEIAAQILRDKQGSGTLEDGIRKYHGMTTDINGVGPDKYLAEVNRHAVSFANQPMDLNRNAVGADQAGIEAGKAYKPAADAVGSEIGTAALKFNDGAAMITKAAERFASAVSMFVAGGGTGSPGAPGKTLHGGSYDGGSRVVHTP